MLAAKDELFTRPSGSYTIGKSVRTRASASAYLNRTMGTPTNSAKWTWSFWLKRGKLAGSDYPILYSAGIVAAEDFGYFRAGTEALWVVCNSVTILASTQVFRDTSAWYNMIFVFDGGNATASNRLRVYLNGVEITAWATDLRSTLTSSSSNVNKSGTVHRIATDAYMGAGDFYDGYLTEINFIDGQALTPSSFGSTNAITGVWQPAKYTGTYGNNGFYLNFSSNGTAAALGTDFSGNSNTWTVNNISVTAGTTYDSMTDVPTLTSATAANYAVLNPLAVGSTGTSVVNNGNLSFANSSAHASITSTMGVTSGKYYFECTVTTSNPGGLGFTTLTAPYSGYPSSVANLWWVYDNTGSFNGFSQTTTLFSIGSKIALNQVWQVALDMDNGKAWIGINNTWYDSSGGSTGNPSTGANAMFSSIPSTNPMFFFVECAGNAWAGNFGQRPFSYTPPTGFVALNTYNLPTSTITNGAAYMAATLYTGTSGNVSVVDTVNGIGFQPDFIWVKARSNAQGHSNIDSVRGANKLLQTNLTNAESTLTNPPTFNSDGFTSTTDIHTNGYTYVAWQWKAGTTSSSNTNGSITSTVSVGATQGFSVVTYTTTGSAGTVGHGLGVAPDMIILKNRTGAADDWYVYHSALGNTKYLILDGNASATTASTWWNNTSPTSTVFSLGSAWSVVKNYVAYCFAAVKGFSAFGSYTGNGSSDGPFVYTGFRPRWLLLKNTGGVASWYCLDSSRNTYNVEDAVLVPNTNAAEVSITSVDFLSNGFKLRTTTTDINGSGTTYIYACFAEVPFKSALAR